MTGKLIPDSETMVNERPTTLSSEQKEKFFIEMAQEIIKEGYSTSDVEDIAHDLSESSFSYKTGFEIAKDLDHGYSSASYDFNSGFIAFLEDLSYEYGKRVDENVKDWVKAFNIKPALKLGDKLMVNEPISHCFKKDETIFVNNVKEDEARYTVSTDPKQNCGFVIAFEKIEAKCTLIKNIIGEEII